MRTNEEIIDIIKTTLSKKDMSLSELARRVGMAKSAVSRYLNGSREFPLNRANDFANALHITTEYLLGFEERPDRMPDSEKDEQTTQAAHFNKEDLTEEEIEEVNKFIEWIKNRDK
ncbi:helix-turn-helix domain-containing protein [Staphylococcus sp. LKG3-1]|uniref:helix-turn-helix domain-containing protein n=1 Tax=unclassified Staphylococcus TaxID=91994 RepID=UPI003B006EEF